MRILVDTNIVLDFLLEREPFFPDAELLFRAIDEGRVIGYVTATTPTDIFYIARRQTRSLALARQAVSDILAPMGICPVDRPVLEMAFNSGAADFEDAVQIFSAVVRGLEAIVTRDTRFSTDSPVPVLSVSELWQPIEPRDPD